MADILATFGTIAGYTVTLQRRGVKAGDPFDTKYYLNAQALVLTKGSTVTELEAVPDEPPYANANLLQQGKGIMAAFAAIGAQVTFGDPAAPIIANPNGSGAYIRAVDLVPGTPVPPGRGVRVNGASGSVVRLKLANGGTIPASDGSGGSGTNIDNVAVVDVVTPVPADVKVQILY